MLHPPAVQWSTHPTARTAARSFILERDGSIVVKAVADRNKRTPRKFIKESIGTDAEKIIPDEYAGYSSLGRDHLHIRRGTVNHSAEERVCGDSHTNTIEGVPSLFKRSLVGAFHKVSAKHLDLYLDEFEYRFNNRDNPFILRDAMNLLLDSGHLEYRELVSHSA